MSETKSIRGMAKSLELTARYFKFLKHLEENSGQVFPIKDVCKKFKVDAAASKVLQDNNIIEKESVGRERKYNWISKVKPNIKMAERLQEEVVRVKSGGRKEVETSAPRTIEEGGEIQPKNSTDSIAETLNRSKKLIEQLNSDLKEKENIVQELEDALSHKDNYIEELKGRNRQLNTKYEQHISSVGSKYETADDAHGCTEVQSKFSLLWGVISYSKVTNK